MELMSTNKQNPMLMLAFGNKEFFYEEFSTERRFFYCLRYVFPSDIQADAQLPTLADYLKKYIPSSEQSIIMYLHGQDGTR